MNRFYIKFGASVLIFAFMLTAAIVSFRKDIEKDKLNIEANIGKRVVIGTDTLLITDYSFLHSNYTLSNGTNISFKLFENLTIIED